MDISVKMPSLRDKIMAKAEVKVKKVDVKKSKVAKLGKKKGKK